MMATRFIAQAALAVSVFGLAGCAGFSAPQKFGLDESGAQLVRQTCNEIMGLRNGPEFEACGGSLSETVRNLQNAALTAQADQACEQQGFARGSVEQAKSVVMFRRSPSGPLLASTEPMAVAAAVPEAQPWQSYFSMSQAQQEERAELSCAQLGLHPATGYFWHCVSDLKYAVANIRFETVP
jgi:hypothetical protein